jgi:1-aminocyclopropane-1-carboxylate deaminase
MVPDGRVDRERFRERRSTLEPVSAMGLDLHLPSPLTELSDKRLGSVRLLLKRDDLIGGSVSGNKWRKLRYLVEDARQADATTLLTFGGAYSNHIRAVAAAGQAFGFRTIGVIRGDEEPFNDSLAYAAAHGMQLIYVSRADYRRRREPGLLAELRERLGSFYCIPEGGSTPFAVRGCAEIVSEIDIPFDMICCPVGTGGTLAGLSAGLRPGQRALGFSVLRGAGSLGNDVAELQERAIGRVLDNWAIDHRFHFGGFARRTPDLDRFIQEFAVLHGVELEWVYVAKMMFGILAMVREGEIHQDASVVGVITGAPWSPEADRTRSTPSRRR